MKIAELEVSVNDYLTRISSVAEEIDTKKDFNVVQNAEDNFDIVFDNKIKLSSLLPPGILFKVDKHREPYAEVHWRDDTTIEPMNVNIDPDQLNRNNPRALCYFAHELGHILSVHEHYISVERRELYDVPLQSRSEDNLEQSIQYSLYAASIGIQIELEAWNYGKAVYDLFGCDDSYYDSVMSNAIDSYVSTNFKQALRELDEKLEESSDGSRLELMNRTFKIFDINTQQIIDVRLSDILVLFHKIDQMEDRMFEG